MPAPQPLFSPRQVAQALDASESSVKRWCDKGAIATIRTGGGHRRITLDALQRFLQQSKCSLRSPQSLGLPNLPAQRENSVPGGQSERQRAFRQALAAGEEATCRSVLNRHIAAGNSICDSTEYLITDAMHGIGEAWDCKAIDAYQERRACDLCIRLINELRASIPPAAASAPVAIGGAPEGDPYQLPTALVELALREIGWNATSLGNNLPIDSLLQAVHDHRPKLVWLSVSVIDNPSIFVAAQNQLASQLGDDVSLLIGGRALTDEIRPKLRYTAHCDSLRSVVDLASVLR